jgi:hypothetical protein
MKYLLTTILFFLPPAQGQDPKIHLVPIYDLKRDAAASTTPPMFHAVVTNVWFPGLVPIFLVQEEDHLELRRLPLRGMENSSEPLFFCVPPADEPEAALIAGRWECEAVREVGSKVFLNWDLTIQTNQLSGRFDQDTDYRFATIVGGTFRSNQIELRIDYIAEAYRLTGKLQAGRLKGLWVNLDGSEKGPWEARREKQRVRLPQLSMLRELYEYRQKDGPLRRYLTSDASPGPEWVRADRPLGRVWRVK